MSPVAENILRVRERIHRAAERAGRGPDEVTLIAVSKTVDADRIREAYAAGVADFGENYVQDAIRKLSVLPGDLRWHFIGHLQTNKVRHVVGAFALVHSLDSARLADEMDRRAAARGIVQDVLIEVRLDPEGAKTGVEPDRFGELVDHVAGLPALRLAGLMGMAPIVEDPEAARPHFARLRSMMERLPESSRRILSMGMTSDFEAAIMEGATHVRIGTAIFGPRS